MSRSGGAEGADGGLEGAEFGLVQRLGQGLSTQAVGHGLGLVVLGLLPRSESPLTALKLVAIWALVQLAGATAAQLVGRAVRRKGTAA